MKRYDRAYFQRWYRDPRSRVGSRAALQRRVRMVVAIAEHVLERPLRSVLDVGCGEGAWQPVLRRLQPRAGYLGLDPSPYVLRRFGARRNIRPGRLSDLAGARPSGPFDLVLCTDVLHYVGAVELRRGLAQLRELVGGIAYLSVLTTADAPRGDLRGWLRRTPTWYRAVFERQRLAPVGMQCYVPSESAWRAASLELARGGGRAGRHETPRVG